MVRLSPNDRRVAIIDAALAVARRQGLGATTVRDVAAEMGTSSGLIHHYFDTMDDVLAAVFDRVASEDLAMITTAVDKAEDTRAAMAAFLDSYAREEDDWRFQLWMDAWSEDARRPALRMTTAKLNVAWQRVVQGIVEEGVTAGLFTVDDTEEAAWRIISLLDGLVLQVVAHETTIDRDRMAAWARRGVEKELGLIPQALGR